MEQASEKLRFLMQIFKAGIVVARKLNSPGLGFADLAALYAVSQEPAGRIKQDDLAGKVGMAIPELNRILTPLEKMAVIKKEAQGRSAYIILTDTGKSLLINALQLAEMRCKDLIPQDQEKNMEEVNKFLTSIKQ